MSPNDMTADDIEAMKENRKNFRALYTENASGPGVLAVIGNDMRVFSMDPNLIDPAMVAQWNRILYYTGILHEDNIFELVAALCSVANDRDLAAAEKRLKEDA